MLLTDMANIGTDLIPVRMLTQFAYCKRLSYMEWVQGEFAYNADVLDGKYQHRNVDKPSGGKKLEENTDEKFHARSVTLSDNTLGIIAKTDLLELDGNLATPVEYKRGFTPENQHQSYEDHMVQVCAQGLLLRANGYTCNKGIVYYASSRQRIEINFDDALIEKTIQMIKEMKHMAQINLMPPPLQDSPKCPRCSLVGICLPDETNLLSQNTSITRDSIRRMYPIRDDAIPVYVQEHGAYVSKSGQSIHIKTKEKILKKIRLIDVSELILFGNIQVSTQAIRELSGRNIPICYMTYGGWFSAITTGLSHKNIQLRISQHRIASEKNASMAIARQIVHGKIKNCTTMLRRNSQSTPDEKIKQLEEMAERATTTKQYDTLLGIEGIAARTYFSEFSNMIKSESIDFDFTGRNRRPPKDPVNAILSFLYSMLARQATTILHTVGLDEHLGFLHMPKYGKPALALDLIEEFRPIIADSVCITMINNGEIKGSDFTCTPFGTNLSDSARRTVITAYERRMDSAIMHPLLGYTASYRRIMQTQARLLCRHILGEIPSYPAFRTR